MKRVLKLIAALIVAGVLAASLRGYWQEESLHRESEPPMPAPAAEPAPTADRVEVTPSAPAGSRQADHTNTPQSHPEADADAALRMPEALVAHARPDPARCLAATGDGLGGRRLAVHRWVDANGITHFSDKPPTAASRDHRVIEVGGVPPIVVRARGHDVNLPDLLEQRVRTDAQTIERVLREALGIDGAPGFVLDINFVQAPEAYARFVPSPALAGSAGAYSSRERTIHVRWQADEEAAFTILRHEITHALVHERIGNLPVAINEGLAGYFERLAVAGLGAQVALGHGHGMPRTAPVSMDGGDELVDLLARDPAAFYAEGREVRYQRAFALIATMMARAEGRAALAAVLAAQREDSCVAVDAPGLLDVHYPGGLAALAADWARWLRDPPATVHAY